MSEDETNWQIREERDERILSVGGKEYRTRYSARLIEKIIERKGSARAPKYLAHKNVRAKYLEPLFERLNATRKDLRVLEVGCSAGHITEYLNEQPSIGAVCAFDVDRAFVDITRMKVEELGLEKVERVDHLTSRQTTDLPYADRSFDLIVVLAVVEHLPVENRWAYVDEYYRKVKCGGLVAFWETPNRAWPFETHSIGLPGVQWLPPQWAFSYARTFKKSYRQITFSEFMRPGSGWRNAAYGELLPKTLTLDVRDVSDETGYPVRGRRAAWLGRIFRLPPVFFAPWLNVVFRVEKDYERGDSPEQADSGVSRPFNA